MFKKVLPILWLFFCVTSSQASLVTWTLDDVTFDDGGIAIGSFVFDANSNSVIDWNLSASGGLEGIFPEFNYTPATVQEVGVFDTRAGGQSFQFFVDPFALGGTSESRLLSLTTDVLLTNAGGTVTLLTQIIVGGKFWQSVECYNCTPFRFIVSGSLSDSSSAVPVPAAVWLFGTGILGLIGFSKRRKAA